MASPTTRADLQSATNVRLAVAAIGGSMHFGQAIIFLGFGYPVFALASVFAVGCFAVMAALVVRGHRRIGSWIGFSEVVVHVLCMIWIWGRDADYWIYFVPLAGGAYVSFDGDDCWDRRIATGLPLVLGPLAFFLARHHVAAVLAPPAFLETFAFFNMIGAVGGTTALIIRFARIAGRAEAEANRERARSDKLLLDILPSAIAARLKDGATTIVDECPAVSVLFADIVGFTTMAARLSTEEVIARLNRIFTAFDALADRHGLEKIKTIGDAYMVVGGVPEPRADHARAIARMALDMRQAVATMRFDGDESLAVRIGIHSGPVVAGVIGTRKFSYDLWGDTVNVASRMESHGEPGRIQVSADTRALLADGFVLEERGTTAIKGRGEMTTFFLEGHG